MVAVPRTTLESGIPFGIAYNLLNYLLTIYSIHLLLESARVTGIYSMPGLTHKCFGYYSLYFVNFVQFIAFGIMPIAYFIIFGGILSSFLKDIPGVAGSGWSFVGQQWFSVLILAVLIFGLIIQKQISELSIAGVLLFAGVILFNILLWIIRIDAKGDITYKDGDDSHFYRFAVDQALLYSLSTAFVAYGFQSAFFPIYNAIENKNYKKGMQFAIFGMGFCFTIYVIIMFSGLYTFGTQTDGDVMNNIAGVKSWESYVLRSIFLLIMITHTPFTFFIGKESVLSLAVLIYSSFVKSRSNSRLDIEEPIIEEMGEAEEGLIKTADSLHPAQSKSRVRRSKLNVLRSMHFSEDRPENLASVRSSEICISMAIPFSRRTLKTTEVASTVEEHEIQNLPAHALLPNSVYYPVTIILFAGVVGTACIIKDVESVIKYIGSLGNSILNFLIPGICYFIIMRKYERKNTSNLKLFSALGLAIYGGVLALLCTAVNVWTTFQPLKGDTD